MRNERIQPEIPARCQPARYRNPEARLYRGRNVGLRAIFIPNEQVYRFIYEEDQAIIDNALKQKVIMCSPLTLYIVLAVIRQAAQNFNIEQRSQEIVDVVNDIRKEWEKYTGRWISWKEDSRGCTKTFMH